MIKAFVIRHHTKSNNDFIILFRPIIAACAISDLSSNFIGVSSPSL